MVVVVVSSGERGEGASPKETFFKMVSAIAYVKKTWPDAILVDQQPGRRKWEINSVDVVYAETFKVM